MRYIFLLVDMLTALPMLIVPAISLYLFMPFIAEYGTWQPIVATTVCMVVSLLGWELTTRAVYLFRYWDWIQELSDIELTDITITTKGEL